MAEWSTTNLLAAVNKVLENIGERKQLSLSSPVARKCAEALGDTVPDVATVNDWEWARETIVAQSWTNEVADLGDVQRLHGVSVGDDLYGFRTIPWTELQAFDRLGLDSYSGVLDMPRVYCMSTYNRVKFNPYPIDSVAQSRFRFYVTQSFPKPVLPTDLFPFPERIMPLVFYRAMHMMALNHLDDPAAAQNFAQQYEMLAQRLKNREKLTPSGGSNMFRHRGYHRY